MVGFFMTEPITTCRHVEDGISTDLFSKNERQRKKRRAAVALTLGMPLSTAKSRMFHDLGRHRIMGKHS